MLIRRRTPASNKIVLDPLMSSNVHSNSHISNSFNLTPALTLSTSNASTSLLYAIINHPLLKFYHISRFYSAHQLSPETQLQLYNQFNLVLVPKRTPHHLPNQSIEKFTAQEFSITLIMTDLIYQPQT